ncbi:MAG: hypothetical protein H6Q52_2633 [Deltaproteobacteria bacterium]|nr:hypothetical protein [Deltaproteobacteria bacterium]
MAISISRLLLVVVVCLCLPAFLGGAVEKDGDMGADTKNLLTAIEGAFPGSSQVILVTLVGASAADERLSAFELRDDEWKPVLKPVPALIGRNGFAPPGEKREGDGRTPPGIYSLGFAFGYGPKIDSAMPYRQMARNDIWVDDPASPDYNQLKKSGETRAKSFEDMVLKDDRYKYGIVIRYNMDPVTPGHGSAIFLHVWKDDKTPTSGCVAISEENILKLLKWLDPAKKPLIMLEKP